MAKIYLPNFEKIHWGGKKNIACCSKAEAMINEERNYVEEEIEQEITKILTIERMADEVSRLNPTQQTISHSSPSICPSASILANHIQPNQNHHLSTISIDLLHHLFFLHSLPSEPYPSHCYYCVFSSCIGWTQAET